MPYRSSVSRRSLLRGGAALPFALLGGHSYAHAQGTPPSEASDGVTPDPDVSLVPAINTFALDLYDELQLAGTGNLIFSPFSVSQALTMTYAGAAGETASQMADALGFNLPPTELNDTYALLNADLVARGSASEEGALRVANALWGERTYPFSSAYSNELERAYSAGLHYTDFAGDPEGAREDINTWVAEQTEERITDIVPPDAITPMTRLVIANAIYFFGPWRHRFTVSSTVDDVFHLADGSETTVPFMVQQETFAYASGDGWQAIDLPYEQDGITMTILLPDEGRFTDVEESLGAGTIDDVVTGLDWTEVRLHLPRFEFEFATSVADALMNLGVTDAFDANRADFSGMVDGVPAEPLSIGDVLHKAFISIDEEGTEAAAATAVIGEVSAAPPSDEPIELRIDRPFIFTIRDTVTGSMIFLGRVVDPSA